MPHNNDGFSLNMGTWWRATQRHRSITCIGWASVPEGPGAWRGWSLSSPRLVSRALLCAGLGRNAQSDLALG